MSYKNITRKQNNRRQKPETANLKHELFVIHIIVTTFFYSLIHTINLNIPNYRYNNGPGSNISTIWQMGFTNSFSTNNTFAKVK